MFQARNSTTDIVLAEPGLRAMCPVCDAEVLAKCGDIVTWHFAHVVGADCDTWSEGEGPWHLGWKLRAAPEQREVKIGNHRADIVGRRNIVVELQHSPISTTEIEERERFYRAMVWVFDVRDAVFGDRLTHHRRFSLGVMRGRPERFCRNVTWKHARKSIAHCQAPVFLDIDNWDDGWLLRLDRFDPDAVNEAEGTLIPKDDFVEQYIG